MIDVRALTARMSQGERVTIPLVEPGCDPATHDCWTTDPEQRARLMYAQARLDATTPPVRRLASDLARSTDPIAALVAFVQSLPSMQFNPDEGTDWYQGSVRTLREGGNCTAKTILGLALAFALDVPACVGWIFRTSAGWDHVAPLYGVGGRWQWGETLIAGAKLGEHPFGALERLRG